MSLRHRQQLLGAQPLRPQRGAPARPAPRQQQRARRVLAEARREHRRAPELLQQELLDLLGRQHQIGQLHRRVRRVAAGTGVGEAQHDAVVAPDGLHLEAGARPEPRLQRQRPGRVHARPQRRQDAHAVVTQLVTEALHRDGAIRRQRPGRLALVLHIAPQVARRAHLQLVLAAQPVDRIGLAERAQLAHEHPHGAAQLDGSPHALAAPERHHAGLTRGRLDDDAVARDLDDAPARGAEQEGLPGPRLVHHLLVELADARAVMPEIHAEKAAIRDGAAVDQRDQPGVAPPHHDVARAVPAQARAQIGQLVRRIAPRQHVEHAQQQRAR